MDLAPSGSERRPGAELEAPEPDPTPLPVDPEVRVGTLGNGLTYYVRSNDAPGASLSLRLVVNAGSLQEDVAGSGVAHFVEHMLFNGTVRWPGNTMDTELQRLGAELGPDLNAYTTFDETVYQLDLQTTDPGTVEVAFDILGEWASAAAFDPEEVAAERGVIREEYRLSADAPGWAAAQRILDYYYQDTAYDGRQPIGTSAEAIMATEAGAARLFYDRWYRPDQMAVVAVGDLPVEDLEAAILDRFADDRPRADAPERIDNPLPLITQPIVDVVADPTQVDRFVSLDYTIPVWPYDTVGGEELSVWEDTIGFMIATRLDEAATAGTADLIDPFAGAFTDSRNRRFLGFSFDGVDSAQALADVLTILETIEANGFSDAEVQRAQAAYRSAIESYAASADRTQDLEWAALYVDHFLTGADISSPADTVDRLTGLIDEFDAGTLSDHYRWLMAQSAPVIVVAGPDETELPTIDRLTEIVENSSAADEVVAVDEIDRLMDAGAPFDGTTRSLVQIPQGFRWDFPNGVTVGFAPSDIAPDYVGLYAESDGGWSLLPAGSSAYMDLVTAAVGRSGLADIDPVALNRYLADKRVALAPFIGETVEGFSGNASPDDLEVLFQMLHLMITAPRVDETAFAQVLATELEYAEAVDTDPYLAEAVAVNQARYGEAAADRPWIAPRDELERFTADQALDLYRARFANLDDLVVIVAGDTDADTVGALAATYLGTLPTGESETWADLSPPPPEGIVTERIAAGPANSPGSVTYLAGRPLPVEDFSVELDAAVAVLDQIIQSRLFDSVREALAASYGGVADVYTLREPDSEVHLDISIEGDPGRVDEILEVTIEEITDLATSGPSQDELDRAVAILRTDLDFENVGGLMDQILAAIDYPDERVLTNTNLSRAIGALTSGDVQDLAEFILGPEQWIAVLRTPAE